LSYYEISCIAKYIDHNDIEKFMRISKACHYSACSAIIQNITAFKRQIDSANYKDDEEYLKANLPEPSVI